MKERDGRFIRLVAVFHLVRVHKHSYWSMLLYLFKNEILKYWFVLYFIFYSISLLTPINSHDLSLTLTNWSTSAPRSRRYVLEYDSRLQNFLWKLLRWTKAEETVALALTSGWDRRVVQPSQVASKDSKLGILKTSPQIQMMNSLIAYVFRDWREFWLHSTFSRSPRVDSWRDRYGASRHHESLHLNLRSFPPGLNI